MSEGTAAWAAGACLCLCGGLGVNAALAPTAEGRAAQSRPPGLGYPPRDGPLGPALRHGGCLLQDLNE